MNVFCYRSPKPAGRQEGVQVDGDAAEGTLGVSLGPALLESAAQKAGGKKQKLKTGLSEKERWVPKINLGMHKRLLWSIICCFSGVFLQGVQLVADRICATLNDSIHSSLNMIQGKQEVLEGQVAGHLSATRSFVDTSTAQLRDATLTLSTATNQLDLSCVKHGETLQALQGVIESLGSRIKEEQQECK